MEYTKEIHELQQKLNDIVGNQFLKYDEMFDAIKAVLENLTKEQKKTNGYTIELGDNMVKLHEVFSKAREKDLKMLQVLMTDYVVQIAKLSGQPQTEVGKRILDKINDSSNSADSLFVVK